MPEDDLPTFLVIGAAKAGTSTVFGHLQSHPQIFVPPQKEVHFFSEHNRDNGIGWYRELFADGRDSPVRGEVSPGYSADPLFPGVADRIAEALPDVKLVYLIRQPVERLISNYRQDAHYWNDTAPIQEALLDKRHLCRSQYAHQINQYLDHFDRDRILIETTEDLDRDPAKVMRNIFSHIGADPSFELADPNRRDNTGASLKSDSSLSAAIRKTPLHSVGKKMVPKSVRHKVWERVGSESVDQALVDLTISDELRQQIVDELQPDLEQLRTLLPGFDCWGLLSSS